MAAGGAAFFFLICLHRDRTMQQAYQLELIGWSLPIRDCGMVNSRTQGRGGPPISFQTDHMRKKKVKHGHVKKPAARVRLEELIDSSKDRVTILEVVQYCRPHMVERPPGQSSLLGWNWNTGSGEPNLGDLLKIAEFFRVKDITKLIERVPS